MGQLRMQKMMDVLKKIEEEHAKLVALSLEIHDRFDSVDGMIMQVQELVSLEATEQSAENKPASRGGAEHLLLVDYATRALIRKFINAGSSNPSILESLNRRGCKTAVGKPFDTATVSLIVRRIKRQDRDAKNAMQTADVEESDVEVE